MTDSKYPTRTHRIAIRITTAGRVSKNDVMLWLDGYLPTLTEIENLPPEKCPNGVKIESLILE